jgi:glycine cleavage system aminomethyltransferase T
VLEPEIAVCSVLHDGLGLGSPRTCPWPAGKFEIEINGERYPAEIVARALYDPSGARMRSS